MPTTFNSVDPSTGESGAQFTSATPEDVATATAAAAAAHRSGALRDRARRSRLLRGAAQRLRAAADEIVPTAMAETGLPEPRLRGELERTAGQLELFANSIDAGEEAQVIIDPADADAKPIPRPDLRRMLVALGPVAVFGASNFPLAFSTAGGDTASALAAGCPVVFKGHPSHPATSELVARELSTAVADAGLPEGVFGHLTAAGVEVGETLVDDSEITAVGFTGSYRGGRAIADRAAARPQPIPVYAEMGSVNPLVVTDAALAERGEAIAEGLAASVSGFGGQLCTKPGVVFVPAGETGDAFVADLAGRLAALDPSVLLNEGLRDTLHARLETLRTVDGVRTLASGDAGDEPGFRAHPAVYEAAAAAVAASPELLEEYFGPVVVVLRHDSTEELLAAIDALGGQLTGTIHAGAGEDVTALSDALAQRVGRVIFDGFPTGVAVTAAMHHGGPFPAASNPLHTSVGTTAARRFLRPVAFQDAPEAALPAELRDGNPLGIRRRVDGVVDRD